jgi:hypothetical protein
MRAEFPLPSVGSHTKLKTQMDFLYPEVKMSDGGSLVSHRNNSHKLVHDMKIDLIKINSQTTSFLVP